MTLPSLRMTVFYTLFPLLVFISACAVEKEDDGSIQSVLRPQLSELGAGNWLVISEAAFPIQSRRGLDVIQLDADIPELVDTVEQVIEETYHIKPRIYLTTEIEHVEYDYAPGVSNYRKKLKESLHGRETLKLDHDILLSILKDTSKSYRVLVIKSRTALPYSSVFMELDSGYWGTESESALRRAMEKSALPKPDLSPTTIPELNP